MQYCKTNGYNQLFSVIIFPAKRWKMYSSPFQDLSINACISQCVPCNGLRRCFIIYTPRNSLTHKGCLINVTFLEIFHLCFVSLRMNFKLILKFNMLFSFSMWDLVFLLFTPLYCTLINTTVSYPSQKNFIEKRGI